MCLGACVHVYIHEYMRSLYACAMCVHICTCDCVWGWCACAHVCGVEVRLVCLRKSLLHLGSTLSLEGGPLILFPETDSIALAGWQAPRLPTSQGVDYKEVPHTWLSCMALGDGAKSSLQTKLSHCHCPSFLFAHCLAEITKCNYRLPACSQQAVFSIQMYLFVCPEFNLKNINSCQCFKFRRFCIII